MVPLAALSALSVVQSAVWLVRSAAPSEAVLEVPLAVALATPLVALSVALLVVPLVVLLAAASAVPLVVWLAAL